MLKVGFGLIWFAQKLVWLYAQREGLVWIRKISQTHKIVSIMNHVLIALLDLQ